MPVTFFLAPSKHFLSLPASDKQAVGHIWSYKSVVPCGRTVVSSMHCGCSNPGSNLGQGSILLSGSRNMTLLFATSSYSWILCLKLTGVLCCLPAAKTAGRLQTEVLAQNLGKCPRATYFMPKLSWLQEGSTGLQWASDTKSSWRMRWQNSEKCSSTPDIKKLPWPSYEPGLLQPQCIELTTIRPQRTTGLQLQTGPTVCLSDAERERKSLPGTE